MARPRGHPQGPRPARRLGLHRADLRRLHRRARAGLGARGRGRARDQDPGEREHHPQHHAARRCRCRTTSCISTTCTRSTGWTSCRRSQGRPEGDLGARADRSRRWPHVLARLFPRSAEPAEEVRRSPASSARSRTATGAPGLQAAARSQPDGGRRITSRRSTSRRRSSRSTPSSAARTRTRTGWSAACRARSTSTARARSARSTWSGSTWSASIIDRAIDFIEQVYIPDLCHRLASTRTGSMAAACRARTCMAYGDIPEHANDYSREEPAAAARRDPQRQSDRGACRSITPTRSRSRSSSRTPGTSIRTRPRACIPFDGVTEPNYKLGPNDQGHADQHRGPRRERQVFLDQVAALEGQRDGGRAARALHHRLRAGQARVQGAGRQAAEDARRAGHGAVLDARPHRRARRSSANGPRTR